MEEKVQKDIDLLMQQAAEDEGEGGGQDAGM